ncbi:unnamed protein product [Closterium sp. Yama58-4]|nr:unnamed protein product [Closterium sp. Yama58-4]
MIVAMATPKRHVCLVAMLVVLAVLSSHLHGVVSVVMQADQAAALLSIKSAMGLTYTTWAATNPCRLEGAAGATGDWERVSCTAGGLAYMINLDAAKLVRKSFPSDISKLTGLGVVWMPWNFLDGSLANYLTYFSTLTNLNTLAMQYMFFSGSFPSLLTTLPSLTSVSLRFNYLTGSIPATITKIKSLDLNRNFLVGSVPTGTWSYCDVTNNCLTSVGNCNSQGVWQRSSCGICGSTDGTGTLCAAGQVCAPNADAKIAASQNNYPDELPPACLSQTMNFADVYATIPVLLSAPPPSPSTPVAAAVPLSSSYE